jgi:hypothetical protein
MIRADENVSLFARVPKRVAAGGYNVLRWVAYEFLPVSVRNTLSARLVDMCRLLGFAAIVSLTIFETGAFTFRDLHAEWPVLILDGVLAILVGNIVKECAIWVCVRVVNAYGRDFFRRGVMLNGKRFSEVFRSDGTWRRCEFGDRETVCEWTDRFGAISRSVTGPRLELRKGPPSIGKSSR